MDTHVLTIDWDSPVDAGNSETIDLTQADTIANVTFDSVTRTFTVTHQYLDDDPTGTPSDEYVVIATVTDDDSGSNSDSASTTLTVDNVVPVFGGLTNSAAVPGAVLPPNQTVTVTNGTAVVLGRFRVAMAQKLHLPGQSLVCRRPDIFACYGIGHAE